MNQVARSFNDVSREASMKAIEAALVNGDLGKLSPVERLVYFEKMCSTLGLNPLTKPFEYITLNNKLVLYATKGCAEQLRANKSVSITIPSRELIEDVYVVTAEATLPDGRKDSATGAVSVAGLKGDQRANAMMKAETKAKRRVTLSVCGLNMLDETEVESIKAEARRVGPEQPPEDGSDGVIDPHAIEIKYGPLAKQYVHESDPGQLRAYILSEWEKWKKRGLSEPPFWAREMVKAAEPIIAQYEIEMAKQMGQPRE